MAKKLIIANWKMNLSPKDSASRIKTFASLLKNLPQKRLRNIAEIVVCPSFSALSCVGSVAVKTGGLIGSFAQDFLWSQEGASTGEESAVYLKELGVKYVIAGHSERRMYMGETDVMVGKKVEAILSNGSMAPVICVGEKKDERVGTIRKRIVRSQIISAISFIRRQRQKRPFVIAYEPVWAIGTGIACTPVDCARMYAFIKKTLSDALGAQYVSKWCRILYGGSVSGMNIKDFVVSGVSDGALVGGASLLPREFFELVRKVVL